MNVVLLLGLLINSEVGPARRAYFPLCHLSVWQLQVISVLAGRSASICLVQGPEHHSVGPGWCGGPGVLVLHRSGGLGPVGGRDVADGGPPKPLAVLLTAQPARPVTVTFEANPRLSFSRMVLHFGRWNWFLPQTVAVAARRCGPVRGCETITFSLRATSRDPQYAAVDVADGRVSVIAARKERAPLATGTLSANVSPILQPPTIRPIPPQTATDDENFRLQIPAENPHDVALRFDVTGLPDGLFVDEGFGVIGGLIAPDASGGPRSSPLRRSSYTYHPTVTVRDAFRQVASASFELTVRRAQPKP
jgi:hypothetical protein